MKYLTKIKVFISGAMICAMLFNYGCGGGSAIIGGAPIVTAPVTRSIVIEGRALRNKVTRAASNAAIEGDSPIANAEAELVLVNTNGTLGSVVAKATTDANGFFSFGRVTVPSETTRFIIRVTAEGQTVSRFLPAPATTTEPLRIDLSTTVATGYILEQILTAPALLADDLSSNMETYITKFDEYRQNGTAAPVDLSLSATDQTAAIAQLKGIVEPTPVEPTPNEPTPPATGGVEIITRGK